MPSLDVDHAVLTSLVNHCRREKIKEVTSSPPLFSSSVASYLRLLPGCRRVGVCNRWIVINPDLREVHLSGFERMEQLRGWVGWDAVDPWHCGNSNCISIWVPMPIVDAAPVGGLPAQLGGHCQWQRGSSSPSSNACWITHSHQPGSRLAMLIVLQSIISDALVLAPNVHT